MEQQYLWEIWILLVNFFSFNKVSLYSKVDFSFFIQKKDLLTAKWTKVEVRKGKLMARSRHCAFKFDEKTLVITPGKGSCLKDKKEISITNRFWIGLYDRNKIVTSFDFFHSDDNSCEKVDSKSLFCSYRAGHCSWFDEINKKIFFFGGFNQSSQLINDPCLITI